MVSRIAVMRLRAIFHKRLCAGTAVPAFVRHTRGDTCRPLLTYRPLIAHKLDIRVSRSEYGRTPLYMLSEAFQPLLIDASSDRSDGFEIVDHLALCRVQNTPRKRAANVPR